jgi:aldose 1-epimerase
MSLITLTDPAAGTSATIASALGFNCFEFQVPIAGRPADILWAEEGFAGGNKRSSGSGIPILFPFPGRILGTSFSYQGREYPLLAGDGRGNAIHGFVLDRPWRVVEESSDHVTGEFHAARDDRSLLERWPADFRIAVTYALAGTTLSIAVEIDNPDDRPLPCAVGLHPYFSVPLGATGSADNCRVTVPVTTAWELTDMIVTGRQFPADSVGPIASGMRFSEMRMDNVFGGMRFENGRCTARIDDPVAARSVQLTFDETFPVCVVYNPPHRQSVCIEPYTCVPGTRGPGDSSVNAGWKVLPPGQSLRTELSIHVSGIAPAATDP